MGFLWVRRSVEWSVQWVAMKEFEKVELMEFEKVESMEEM